MAKLKVGVIGCGGIANGKHLPSLQKQGDRVELVAFCDLIVERAEAGSGYIRSRRCKGLCGLS